jgi:hypothetical protein
MRPSPPIPASDAPARSVAVLPRHRRNGCWRNVRMPW